MDRTSRLLQLLKPAAPAWTHYLLAALLWTGVGSFLLYRGLAAALTLHTTVLLLVSLGAGSIGMLKGLMVMRPAAVRGAARIAGRGDGKCVMGFISWKTWLLVLGMGAFGKYLRTLALPGWLLGLLLGGVGTALLIGSATYWTSFVAKITGAAPIYRTPPK